MSLEAININKYRILPGQSKEIILNTYQLASRTNIDIPVFVFRSVKPGPVVLLQAGMHGDEINGIETLRNLLKMPEVRNPLRGSIIIIPILNAISFINGSRDLPDEKDLNRCFPGSKTGSLGSRIAYDLMKQVIPQIDFGIDFHTGGAKINNYPQLRCVFSNPQNIEIAEKFGASFIINSGYREKSLRKEAEKRGKSILVFEGGESMRFNKQAINEGIEGCLRLLKNYGMIDVTIADKRTIRIEQSTWIRAKVSGLFRTNKKYGVFIEKGAEIGTIADPYGESEVKMFAPEDCFIIGINNQPVINEGDAIMHLGFERSTTSVEK
jgi:predicted deacylase